MSAYLWQQRVRPLLHVTGYESARALTTVSTCRCGALVPNNHCRFGFRLSALKVPEPDVPRTMRYLVLLAPIFYAVGACLFTSFYLYFEIVLMVTRNCAG